eukprot:8624265-Prorocentrum_lima.AAC.1
MWLKVEEARKSRDKAKRPAILLSQKERKLVTKQKATASLQEELDQFEEQVKAKKEALSQAILAEQQAAQELAQAKIRAALPQ